MSRYPTLRSDCSSPALTVSESWNVDEEDSDSETDDYEHIPRMSNAKSPRIFRSHSLRNFHTLQHVESKEGIVSTLSHKQQSNPLIRHCSTVRSTPGPPIPPKPVIKGALSPTEILKNHQAKLPLSLELTNGLYGRDQMTTLSQAERVEALYARRVVCAQINIKMEVYKVPLSSMFSFAPLYTPGNKLKQAMSGYVFPSPGALLRAKPRPDVAVALRGHVGTNDEATVQAKDVLWILGEETPGYVKCLHAITGATKKLQAKSDILFSTDPTQLFLPLSEVVSHLSLPAKVLMKPPTQLPECVTKVKKLHNTQIVEVIRCVEKSSLICCRTVGVDALDVTFSMPQGVDLEMIAVSQTCQHRQALCLKVAKMLSMNYSDRFIDESLHALQTSGKNRSSFDVQLAFLQAVENCHKSSQPICPADAQLHLTASAGNKAVGSSAEVGNQLHILQRECQFLSIDVNDCKQSVRAVSSTINTKVLPETQEVKKMSIQYLESLQGVYTCNFNTVIEGNTIM